MLNDKNNIVLAVNETKIVTDLLKEKTEAVNQAALKIYESMNANNSCYENNSGDNNNTGGGGTSSDGTFNGESKEV